MEAFSRVDDGYEDGVKVCTVKSLGLVFKWQPKIEDIKEVCYETPYDCSLDTMIDDCNTSRDRYPSPLLEIWANTLRSSGSRMDTGMTRNGSYSTVSRRFAFLP